MDNLIMMQQVHGNNVARVTASDEGKTIPNCDALITNDSKVTLCVRVADCLPISVIDKKTRSFGLIHAGWRGLGNKIIEKTIQKMNNELSIMNYELEVKIGAHICQKHFEVKNDVSVKFSEYLGGLSSKAGRTFLDLSEIAVQQLVSLGIKKENITIDPRCTFEDERLYSYRRDKTDKRNMIYLSFQP